MTRSLLKKWLLGLALLLSLMFSSKPAFAQWPPFNFQLIPSYESGKIKYSIAFSGAADWVLDELTIKISIPEGTRFLEANAQPTTNTSFDGKEVTFFTPTLNKPIKVASFVVEVIDPAQTIFTTRAWIGWQGEQPGAYLGNDVSIDVTRPSSNWTRLPNSRLRLNASATATGEIITYSIYSMNRGELRMWDVKINVPLPEGTVFLSAGAPPPFVANFDGREVSFFTSELERQREYPPLTFQVSTAQVVTPFVVTHAWANWKNVGRKVGLTIEAQEQTLSGDIVVQPRVSQQVMSDRIGDVPLAQSDLTSIALQEDGTALKVTFYTAGSLGPTGEVVSYILYIDKDCRSDTGRLKNDLGQDYQIRYLHNKGRANFNGWNEVEQRWVLVKPLKFSLLADTKLLTLWVPYDLLENSQQFCWQAEAKDGTHIFNPKPPVDTTTVVRYESLAVTPPITTTAPATDR